MATITKEKELVTRELESKTLRRVLLENEALPAGQEKRLLPHLDVSRWDRLHFHFSNGNRGVAGLKARILFGTPMPQSPCGELLADSTVWFEDTVSEREFTHIVPDTFGGTGFVMSVPVVAPNLFDVILTNVSDHPLDTLYVTVMAQEI